MTDPNATARDCKPGLPRLRRPPDRWAAMVPARVAEGSQAQVTYALQDAQHDIAVLLAALLQLVERLTEAVVLLDDRATPHDEDTPA